MHKITIAFLYDGVELNDKHQWVLSYARGVGLDPLALVHEHTTPYSSGSSVEQFCPGTIVPIPVLFII